MAVPCRSSRLRGRWTPHRVAELRRQLADDRQLCRMPSGPHRTGTHAPQVRRGRPLSHVPRRIRHRCDHGRGEWSPVRRRQQRHRDHRSPPLAAASMEATSAIRSIVFAYTGSRGASKNSKIQVAAAGSAVTSAHLTATNGLTQPGIAWGNGANGSGAGPAATIGCASCHNPHGNGQYRILNTQPQARGSTTPGSSMWSTMASWLRTSSARRRAWVCSMVT